MLTWYTKYWRSILAAVYGIICIFDFVIAPVGTLIIEHLFGMPYIEWTPLTIQGGGVFHLAFGAILGVSAWGQSREIAPMFPSSYGPMNPNYPPRPIEPINTDISPVGHL
jgi:hypothetical protein